MSQLSLKFPAFLAALALSLPTTQAALAQKADPPKAEKAAEKAAGKAADPAPPQPAPSGPSVTLPAKATAKAPYVVLRADKVDADDILWTVDADGLQPVPPEFATPKLGTFLAFGSAGTYRVTALPIKAVGGKAAFGPVSVCVLTVTGPAPQPVPPTPGPAPPGPAPPQPIAGLKVLIVYDSAAEGAMPKAQQMVLRTAPVRDWLNAHCAASTETMSGKAWFIVDKSQDMSSTAFAAWMNRPRVGVPWIVVGSDAGVAYEGPLPADTASTLALLAKYAPSQTSQKRRAA